MYFPKRMSKNDLIMTLAAAAAVLLSGLAMNKLNASYPNFARIQPQDMGEIVSQNAVAPGARADMPAIAGAACPVSLDLLDEGNAMVGGTLLAPCLPGQDLVIAHAGMVYSAKTLASGALFFSLPALKSPATVDIRFTSGETASAQVDMPDALALNRVAVQWPHSDGFSIHAFENGAEFGSLGHIWAEAANAPLPGSAAAGGYLTVLGDPTVDMPLMAQVFTYSGSARTDLLLEAAVTASNCDSELMGDVLMAKGGAIEKTEVTLAMPACDAVGEFVQFGLPETGVDLALAQ